MYEKGQTFRAAPYSEIEKFLEGKSDSFQSITLHGKEMEDRFGVSPEEVISDEVAGNATRVKEDGQWWQVWFVF